jgi:hypothetical protein
MFQTLEPQPRQMALKSLLKPKASYRDDINLGNWPLCRDAHVCRCDVLPTLVDEDENGSPVTSLMRQPVTELREAIRGTRRRFATSRKTRSHHDDELLVPRYTFCIGIGRCAQLGALRAGWWLDDANHRCRVLKLPRKYR